MRDGGQGLGLGLSQLVPKNNSLGFANMYLGQAISSERRIPGTQGFSNPYHKW